MLEWELGHTYIKVLDKDSVFPSGPPRGMGQLPDWSFIGCCEFLRYKGVRHFQVRIPTENINEYWLYKFRELGFKFDPISEETVDIHRKWFKVGREVDFDSSYIGELGILTEIWPADAASQLLLITSGKNRGQKVWVNTRRLQQTNEEHVQIPVTVFEIRTRGGISSLAHNTILRYMWEENGKKVIDFVRQLEPRFGFTDALYIAHHLIWPRYGQIVDLRSVPKPGASLQEGMNKILNLESDTIYQAVRHYNTNNFGAVEIRDALASAITSNLKEEITDKELATIESAWLAAKLYFQKRKNNVPF